MISITFIRCSSSDCCVSLLPSSSPKNISEVLWKEMLDPVFPRLTGTCCTAWSWSRRRVRRVSYLSPRAEIVVIFLAEGVQDIKVARKNLLLLWDLICRCDFYQLPVLLLPPPSLSPFSYLSLQSWVRCCVNGSKLFISVVYLYAIVCPFFPILFCFGDKWESRRGNRSKHGVTQSQAMMSGALCLLSQQRGRCFLN